MKFEFLSEWRCFLLLGMFFMSTSVQASDFLIKDVMVEKMTIKHFCSLVGGNSRKPAIVIKHSKEAGFPIKILMFDDISNGKHYKHGVKTVSSNISGTTTVRPRFFPPCNYTGTTSKYQFTVSSGSSSKTIVWSKFDSKTKRFF